MALCAGILIGWQKLYLEPRQAAVRAASATSVAASAPAANTASAQQGDSAPKTTQAPSRAARATPAAAAAPATPEVKSLLLPHSEIILSNQGGALSQWTLQNYKRAGSQGELINATQVTHLDGNIDFAFDTAAFADLAQAVGRFTRLEDGTGGVRWTYEDDRLVWTREYRPDAALSVVDVRMRAQFKQNAPKFAFLSIKQRAVEDDKEAQDRNLFLFTNNSIEREKPDGLSEIKSFTGTVDYVGAESRYFVMAALPLETPAGPARGLLQPLGNKTAQASLVFPVSGDQFEARARVFLGPKELIFLRNIDPRLDHIVDFGWFTLVAYPLLKTLKFFYRISENYGVAIILLTILLKLLLYPLTYKSAKSMKQMSVIQPQIQRLRDKHKDDKEALNREMLALMRTQGYNPMAGCLPILAQMPIFFALYRVLYSSIELYGAPFAFWITDLSAHDPWFVTPVLLTLTMYLQQKLTPMTTMDPAQQKMMQLMPVIFGAFMVMLPSGLTLYMLINAVMSIFQQIILNKKLGMGNYAAPAGAGAR